MAMKPYAETYLQPCVTYGTQGQNSVVNRVVAERSLTGVHSQVGNYSTPNPHRYQSNRKLGWRGTIYSSNQGYYTATEGSMPYPYTYSTYVLLTDGTALNMALGRMYEALRGSVDLSVDLVQWKKTLEMMHIYRRLVKTIVHDVKKLIPKIDRVDQIQKDLKDAKRLGKRSKRLARELNKALNTLAVARLEYVYGWSPTMGTFHELAKGVIRTEEPGLIRVEGTGKRRHSVRSSQAQLSAAVPAIHNSVISERARVVCWYNPRPNLMDNLARITSLNPVSILYEAAPFSFVLDWIWDVSGWLRTLETAFVHSNEFVKGYQTLTTRCYVDSRMQGVDVISPVQFVKYNLTGVAVVTTFNRSVLTSAPFPTKPVRQQSFGVERQLNAIALVKATLLKADDHLGKWRR